MENKLHASSKNPTMVPPDHDDKDPRQKQQKIQGLAVAPPSEGGAKLAHLESMTLVQGRARVRTKSIRQTSEGLGFAKEQQLRQGQQGVTKPERPSHSPEVKGGGCVSAVTPDHPAEGTRDERRQATFLKPQDATPGQTGGLVIQPPMPGTDLFPPTTADRASATGITPMEVCDPVMRCEPRISLFLSTVAAIHDSTTDEQTWARARSHIHVLPHPTGRLHQPARREYGTDWA